MAIGPVQVPVLEVVVVVSNPTGCSTEVEVWYVRMAELCVEDP